MKVEESAYARNHSDHMAPSVSIARTTVPDRETWLSTLGEVFTRVVLFAIEGTTARVTGVRGLSELLIGVSVPLVDQTPLRWAIEAASPIVGAGRSPSGEVMAGILSLAAPRAFAVVPLVFNHKLAGLAYGDCGSQALPLASVAEVFAACERLLNPNAAPSALPDRVAFRSTARREERISRSPKPNVSPRAGVRIVTIESALDEGPGLAELLEPNDIQEVIDATAIEIPPSEPSPAPIAARPTTPWARPLKKTHAIRPIIDERRDTDIERNDRGFRRGRRLNAAAQREALRHDTQITFTPAEQLVERSELSPFTAKALVEEPGNAPAAHLPTIIETPFADDAHVDAPRRRFVTPKLVAGLVAASVLAFVATAFAPRSSGNVNERVVTLPSEASPHAVGRALAEQKLVRNAEAFALIGALAGAHDVRAGTYRITTGRWPWQVALELRRGEQQLLDVAIPEGLTLAGVAKHLEQARIAQADAFIAAAHAPALLGRYGIPGTDAQGWLASGPYAMARGIGATDVASVMIDRFMATLAALPETKRLDADGLNDVLTLASLVEREAKDKSESARIAGLFMNRLKLGMRLESRATALYILGTEKRELTLADVRQPSPYNTYLNAGLPPAPIANPSLDALRAALHPEEHGYFYMTDRDDGSGGHVFSTTYEEHLKAQRENR